MKYLKFLDLYIKMFRFYNLFLPGACGLVGSIIASYYVGIFNIEKIIAGTFIPVLCWGAGQVVNNYCDQYADQINCNRNSIVKGDINSNNALYFSFIISTLLIILSFKLNLLAGIFSIVGVVSFCAYCFKFKGIPVLGNTWFGFTTSLCVLFGSAVNVGLQPYIFHPIIWTIFILNGIFMGGHALIGYFKDVKGDEEAGYNTLCVVLKDKLKVAALITLVYTFLPVIMGLIIWFYYGDKLIPNGNYLIFQIISLIVSLKAQIVLINDPSPVGGYRSFSMHKDSVTLYFLSWLASYLYIIYALFIIVGSMVLIEYSKKNTKTSMQL